MSNTQYHISINTIKDDLVLLKDGAAALILQTNAVNFGLLSEREQLAIIFSFGQMLNSLSFSIQISIHSSRLDISSYIELLHQAEKAQTNTLLSQMISRYRDFIQKTIKENDVLDKKFYVTIPLSGLELGIIQNKDERLKRAQAMLLPRRDQIIRQLSRVGLTAKQLKTTQLIKLFYEIYNIRADQPVQAQITPVTLAQPVQVLPERESVYPQNPNQISNFSEPRPKNHPFVVEELSDNI